MQYLLLTVIREKQLFFVLPIHHSVHELGSSLLRQQSSFRISESTGCLGMVQLVEC